MNQTAKGYWKMLIIILIFCTPIFVSFLMIIHKLPSLKKKKSIEKYTKNLIKHEPIWLLRKTRPIIISQLINVIEIVSFIFHLPIFAFRMVLIDKYGVKITWLLPVSFYELWHLLWLIISYYYAYINSFYLSIAITIVVFISVLHLTFHDFIKSDGKIRIFERQEYKISITSFIIELLIILLTFSSLYYSINLMFPGSFSKKLSIFESIYFSVISAFTVGYGDIIPKYFLTRTITITEVLVVFIYIVVFLGILINVWIEKKQSQIYKKKIRSRRQLYAIKRRRYHNNKRANNNS